MSMDNIRQTFQKFNNFLLFNTQNVKCMERDNEHVEINNPQFSSIDGHLHYDESEELQQERQLPPHMRNVRRPPNFDGLLNNIRSITKKVEHIKGFKFELQLAGSPKFQVIPSWTIPEQSGQQAAPNPMMGGGQGGMPGGKQQKPHFGLNVQYVGGTMQQLMSQQFPPFIMTGRWDSSGKLECALIKKVRDNVQLRLSAAYPTGSDLQYAQMFLDVDVEGKDYLHTIKYGTGLVSFNHMQSIGKNLVMGFELMNLIERKMAFMNYAFRYNYNRKNNFYAQYMAPNDTFTAAYSLNFKKGAHIVSELNYSPAEGTTSTILGYQQRFENSEVIATINSKGKISTSLNILGMAYALKLCAIADYKKDTYKFGYGLTIGQQQ